MVTIQGLISKTLCVSEQLQITTGGMAVKKYIYCIAMVILTMSLLTGCGMGIELSEEENAMVAEYMAAMLLKYDAQYEDELIYAEASEIAKDEFVPIDDVEDTKTEKEEPVVEQPSVTLDDVFKSNTYHVEYLGVKEYDTYKEPGNDYYFVEAPAGCKLVVVEFMIENIAESDIAVSLADKGISYELVLDLAEKPLLTALMGDLQYYNQTISKGESKVGVVVFAVNKKADISKGLVAVRGKEATYQITVK